MNQFRQDLVDLLDGGKAHDPFDDVVTRVEPQHVGRAIPGSPHTPWRLVEHLRRATRDTLRYVTEADYEALDWPDDYWPDGDAPPGDNDEARFAAFHRAADDFRQATAALRAMLEDESRDPLAPLTPLAGGTSLARNVMLIADHNAWHVGQLALLLSVDA